jgi:hypothetical protein
METVTAGETARVGGVVETRDTQRVRIPPDLI